MQLRKPIIRKALKTYIGSEKNANVYRHYCYSEASEQQATHRQSKKWEMYVATTVILKSIKTMK